MNENFFNNRNSETENKIKHQMLVETINTYNC